MANNLVVSLLLSTGNFSSDLKTAKGQIDSFKAGVDKVGGGIKSFTSTLGVNIGSITKFTSVVGVAALAGEGLKEMFARNDSLGDMYRQTQAQVNEQVDNFFKSIGSGDFTRFLDGFQNINKAAAEAYKALDDLQTYQGVLAANAEIHRSAYEGLRANAQNVKENEAKRLEYLSAATLELQKQYKYQQTLAGYQKTSALNQVNVEFLKQGMAVSESFLNNATSMMPQDVLDKISEFQSLVDASDKKLKTLMSNQYKLRNEANAANKEDKDAKQKSADEAIKALNAEKTRNAELKKVLNSYQAYNTVLNDEAGNKAITTWMAAAKSAKQAEEQFAKGMKEINETAKQIENGGKEDTGNTSTGKTSTPKTRQIDVSDFTKANRGLIAGTEEWIKAQENAINKEYASTMAFYSRDSNEYKKLTEEKKGKLEEFYEKARALNGMGDLSDNLKFFLKIDPSQIELPNSIDTEPIEINAKIKTDLNEQFEALGVDQTDKLKAEMEGMQQLGQAFGNLGASMQGAGEEARAMAKVMVAASQAAALAGAIEAVIMDWSIMSIWGKIAAVISVVATLTSMFATISSFSTGGIVPGSSFQGDNVLVRANSNEMILNNAQQANLFKMLNTGAIGTGGGNQVEFKISGQQLVGVLKNYNGKVGRVV